MSAHTPGPWEARTGRANTSVYIEGTQYVVAIGCSTADAHLIAAAPELLAALRALQGAPADSVMLPDSLWDQILMAIAKATGGAP